MGTDTQFDDLPITSDKDDALGRAPFVSEVTSQISMWDGSSSLVVGLHGRWGDGKTSAVNLLAPLLEAEGLRVLHFNPWEWSNTRDLADAFFDEVSVQLGQTSRKEDEELAKALRRYAARLKGGAGSVALIGPVLKAVLWLVFVASIGSPWIPSFWLRVIGIALALLAGFALAIANLLPLIAESIFPAGRDIQPSLEALKRNLKKSLAAQSRRIVIVMDDIDRLTPKEVVDVTRLVKANGDLPRICYLLIGDREILAEHLRSALSVDGTKYLDKIIQFSFDLPAAEQKKLNGVFFDGLNAILRDERKGANFETDRWGRIFWSGIVPSISNFRNVKRLLAALRASFSLVVGNRTLEVNAVDLIAIETIRVFQPNLYCSVQAEKLELTSPPGDKEKAVEHAERVADLVLAPIDAGQRPRWRPLLRLLFPYLDLRGGYISYGQHNNRSWNAAQRLCSPTYFDRYFQFGVATGDIPTSEVQFFLEPHDRSEYLEHLSKFVKEDKLPDLVSRLRDRVDEVHRDAIEPLVLSMFDVGDTLSPRSNQMWGTSDSTQAEFTVQDLLKRIPNDQTKATLDRLFRGSNALRLPIEILRNFLGHHQQNRLEPFLTEADLETWKELFVQRIAARAADSSLLEENGSGLYLFLWRTWGDPEEAKKYVAETTTTREGALKFLKALVQIAHTSNVNKRGETARPYIRHTDVADYIDPELINDVIGATAPSELEMLRFLHPEFKYFERALKRRREGKSDDGFGFWRDEDEED